MPLVLWVTHQAERRPPAAELSLPGTGHAPGQYLFGDIPAVHIVQDILKGRDIHLLAGQAVHAVRNGNIAYLVLGEKDLDITSGFDIIPAEPGQVSLCQQRTKKILKSRRTF